MGLSFMKCAKVECEKARKLGESFCEEHLLGAQPDLAFLQGLPETEEIAYRVCDATRAIPIDHRKGENCPRCDAIVNVLRPKVATLRQIIHQQNTERLAINAENERNYNALAADSASLQSRVKELEAIVDKQNERITSLSYKAYPARNASGE